MDWPKESHETSGSRKAGVCEVSQVSSEGIELEEDEELLDVLLSDDAVVDDAKTLVVSVDDVGVTEEVDVDREDDELEADMDDVTEEVEEELVVILVAVWVTAT